MASSSLSVASTLAPHPPLTDSHGRVIHDLRVSITDRCNYKCVYCRTGEVGAQYPELANEEYLRMIGLFVGLGITKVRLTGGEPLLRRGVVELVGGAGAHAHAGGRGAGPCSDHQRPSAGVARRPAQSRRAQPGDGEHGRRGCCDLRADHACPGQLSGGSQGHSRRARRGAYAAQNQLRADARLQRRAGRGFCALRPRRRRCGAFYRVHAPRRGPVVDAGDRGDT